MRGERQVRLAVDTLIVLAALLACEGLAQFLVGYGDIDRRIRGPFSHYMTFSGFLLVCDLLLLASMVYTGRWRTPWRWAALAVINVALLGSYTRNAWVALALSLTVMIAFRGRRGCCSPTCRRRCCSSPWRRCRSCTGWSRSPTCATASNYDRLCMLEAGLTMVRQRPVFGVGPGPGEAVLPDLPRARGAALRGPPPPQQPAAARGRAGAPRPRRLLWR